MLGPRESNKEWLSGFTFLNEHSTGGQRVGKWSVPLYIYKNITHGRNKRTIKRRKIKQKQALIKSFINPGGRYRWQGNLSQNALTFVIF